MKIGDLVRIKRGILADDTWDTNVNSQIGIILDIYDNSSVGIINYEVKFAHETGWFDPLELEVISESRDPGGNGNE